ncbi:hypothetical protein ANN_19610 [Periplaneta americana]|uniref:DUF4817 domain-containing protein n=1 Tax=Periplaneta americana TaxID=6978 RepID=A0ABQ8SBF2_PERAM|nr:hypothetical protein ANN_19610 [Periplaneta americana]
MYSNQELAEIHFMYGKADGNAALARRLYQERYPQRQCSDRKTFVRLHYRLCEYGKFNSPDLGRGRPRSTTPEVREEILEAVNMTPSISTRRVALQVNVPHTTVWRLMKEYVSILYPYHLQRVQALSPADYPARLRFCQWFLQQCGVNPNFPALVLFTDEAQFTRDGITNFHNQMYGRMKSHVQLFHLITRRHDTPLINRQHIHFLHDGAPAHFSRTTRRYLDRRFPDRWIGNRTQCHRIYNQKHYPTRRSNEHIEHNIPVYVEHTLDTASKLRVNSSRCSLRTLRYSNLIKVTSTAEQRLQPVYIRPVADLSASKQCLTPEHQLSRVRHGCCRRQRFWHVSLSTMHNLRASVDSVAENGTTSYTRHVSNLPTTVVSLGAQAVE